MGENEQGGMLRVVVVIGLVALIAGVIITGVVVSKANMNKHVMATTSFVEKQANGVSDTDDASTTIFSYYDFKQDAKTVAIKGFDTSKPDWASYSRDLVIPSKVVKDGVTYKVTMICSNAFGDKELTSVKIPDTVTTISQTVFYNNKLTSVTIPNSVTSIGLSAFADNQLTSVTIGNGLTSIADSAFSGNRLISVTIPQSVTTISDRAFEKNQIESLTLLNGLTTIGDYAFYQNNLRTLTVPDTVAKVGASAFYNNKFGKDSVSIGKNTKYTPADPSSGFNSFASSFGEIWVDGNPHGNGYVVPVVR